MSEKEKDLESCSEGGSEDTLLQDYPEMKGLDEPVLHGSRRQKAFSRTASVIIVLLIVSNLVFLFKLRDMDKHEHVDKYVTKYAGLSYNTPVVYRNYTDFQNSKDEEARTKAWNSLDITPLEIMYTDEEASELGLSRSVLRFPWDETRGIYFIKSFHDLHCLKVIQKSFTDFHKTGKSPVKPQHVYHCLDSVRQAIECAADDTPMAVFDLPNKIGASQVRMCRNIDTLIRYTQRPERSPCYLRPGDPTQAKNGIEEYSSCRKDSPYYDLVEQYFAKYGHDAQPNAKVYGFDEGR